MESDKTVEGVNGIFEVENNFKYPFGGSDGRRERLEELTEREKIGDINPHDVDILDKLRIAFSLRKELGYDHNTIMGQMNEIHDATARFLKEYGNDRETARKLWKESNLMCERDPQKIGFYLLHIGRDRSFELTATSLEAVAAFIILDHHSSEGMFGSMGIIPKEIYEKSKYKITGYGVDYMGPGVTSLVDDWSYHFIHDTPNIARK